MPTFQLLPGAFGLDFPGGRHARADRRGRVTVDEETARLVRASSAARRYDALLEVAPGRFRPRAGDRACPCGFSPWPWQSACPRCGAALAPEV